MKLKRNGRMYMLVAVVALAALAALPAPASAGVLVESATSCEAQRTSKPFARWGDWADYALAPGGSFERGTQRWQLAGASIVAGNESFYVGSEADRYSLRLDPRESATSPVMCVGLEHPTLRLFAYNRGALLSMLSVEVIVETSSGLTTSVPVGVALPSSSWRPTPIYLVVANLLPLLPDNYTPVAFRVRAHGGTWWIDDFYVDPRRH